MMESSIVNKNKLKSLIIDVFSHNSYPGDWCIKGSTEGSEPYYVEEEFKGKTDWRKLDANFLDASPRGLASALSFFSVEAYRFYLPAYLLADIDGKLQQVDVSFSLIYGLDDHSRDKKVNPRRYGEMSWFDSKTHNHSIFSHDEVATIIAYLEYKQSQSSFDRERINIEQSLKNYWRPRLLALKSK